LYSRIDVNKITHASFSLENKESEIKNDEKTSASCAFFIAPQNNLCVCVCVRGSEKDYFSLLRRET